MGKAIRNLWERQYGTHGKGTSFILNIGQSDVIKMVKISVFLSDIFSTQFKPYSYMKDSL
jgi:hypothetical protein